MGDLRIGMVGLDTSHCPAYTGLLNDLKNPFHVPGGRVVAAYPGGSDLMAVSRERVGTYTDQLRDEYGVKIMDSIEAVAEAVDAVLLTSVDGRQHLEQFERLASFGKPVFIDKPFTTSAADAERIFALSRERDTPVFSSSSLRYAEGIADLGAGHRVLGCETFGPCAIVDDFPGLFWYGVHSAEILFAKMGAGCKEVSVRYTEQADVVTGVWHDGRVGTLFGYRQKGLHAFGATLFTDGGIFQGLAQTKPPYYAKQLVPIMEFFRTRRAPIDAAETVEIMAFLEAANESRETGRPVALGSRA